MTKADKIRLMIVEDEIITAMLIRKRMTGIGLDVCGIAASGEEAVLMADLHRPDLIMMDIRLSGIIDGIEAAWRIVQSMESKIVFVTGYINEDIQNEVKKINPLAFLTKPVNFDELIEIIKREFSL